MLRASGLLRAHPAPRRALLVISDGAPVDGATLSVNPPDILDRHLVAVVGALADRGDIALRAIGLGYDVTGHVPNGVMVDGDGDLGAVAVPAITRPLSAP